MFFFSSLPLSEISKAIYIANLKNKNYLLFQSKGSVASGHAAEAKTRLAYRRWLLQDCFGPCAESC